METCIQTEKDFLRITAMESVVALPDGTNVSPAFQASWWAVVEQIEPESMARLDNGEHYYWGS